MGARVPIRVFEIDRLEFPYRHQVPLLRHIQGRVKRLLRIPKPSPRSPVNLMGARRPVATQRVAANPSSASPRLCTSSAMKT